MVLRKARCCSWPGRSWIVARRRYFSHHDHSSDSRGRLRLDDAYLCFSNSGSAHFRKFNRPLSNSSHEASIQRDGFRPSIRFPNLLGFDCGSLLLLLCVKLGPDDLQKLITTTGGMFIPFTFIVEEALSHGMSLRLANYLVPILNAARSVLSYMKLTYAVN